jgi:hypothetical protein
VTLPTVAEFFATPRQEAEDAVPRDHLDRPLIIPLPGMEGLARKKDGLIPYYRASSFGKQIEDTFYLELWQKRQVAIGMARRADLVQRALAVGDPEEVRDTSQFKGRKEALNKIVEEAEEAAGSNIKSAQGTAIHGATELIDLGDDLSHLDPLLRDRADAYWRFCREHGMVMTSVEVFGVEDEHRVAGTWDRTGWFRRKHRILDVKTSSSMDFAGIAFAVQLAKYARMSRYDHATGERTPHEQMDLETGIIIHVDRNMGGPVELYEVDLTVGQMFAELVDRIGAARREGRKSIREIHDADPIMRRIAGANTYEALMAVHAQTGAQWTDEHRASGNALAAYFAAQ